MKSLIKIAINNIKNSKIKYLMISLVFMLSILSGIFSWTFSDLAIKTREEQLRKNTLNTQLSIITRDKNDIFFPKGNIEGKIKDIEEVDEVSPRIGGQATFNDESIVFTGIDINKQSKVYDFNYLEKTEKSFDDDFILISKNLSDKYYKSVDDYIVLNINNKDYRFKVAGILKEEGSYQSIEEVFISLSKAQEALDQSGKVYSIGITLKELEDIDIIFNSLSNVIDDKLIVEKRYDINDYKSFIDIISISMSIFTIFSIIISVLLCYSTYRSLVYDRIKNIGIYRSLGVSKLGVYISMFLELIFILIPSVILGEIISNILMKFIINQMFDYSIGFQVEWIKSMIIILIMIAAGLLSMHIAVRDILKKNTIELVKGNITIKQERFAKLKYGFSIVFFIAALIFCNFTSNKNNQFLDVVAMIALSLSFICIGMTLLVVILKLARKFMVKISTKFNIVFQEIEVMIKEMKYSLILIVFIIAIASVSNMLSQIVSNNALNVYKGIDIVFNNLDSYKNEEVEKELSEMKFLDKIVSVNRHSQNIDGREMTLSGIDINKYSEISFEKYIDINKDAMLKKLDEDKNNIIINKTYAKILNKKVGDKISINTVEGEKDFTIAGMVSSFEDKGSVIFFSKESFNKNFPTDYTSYFLCVKDKSSIDESVNELKKSVEELVRYNISTLEQLQAQNEADNSIIFTLINIVIVMSLAVSIACLMNNLMVNLLKRRTICAIKRTLGMELKFIRKLITLEGLIMAVSSSILGILLGVVLNKSILKILSYYIGDVEISSTIVPIVYIIFSIIIVMLVSIYPYKIIKTSNLVELVKGKE